MKSVWYYDFPVGKIGIAESGGLVRRIFFSPVSKVEGYQERETDEAKQAAGQLWEYFRGERSNFTFPYDPGGTSFLRMVYEAEQAIPYGETRTYQQVATMVGKPNAYRAVGMANHGNPLVIVIPCHRVLGKNGSLTGYISGLQTKQTLLDLEQRYGKHHLLPIR